MASKLNVRDLFSDDEEVEEEKDRKFFTFGSWGLLVMAALVVAAVVKINGRSFTTVPETKSGAWVKEGSTYRFETGADLSERDETSGHMLTVPAAGDYNVEPHMDIDPAYPVQSAHSATYLVQSAPAVSARNYYDAAQPMDIANPHPNQNMLEVRNQGGFLPRSAAETGECREYLAVRQCNWDCPGQTGGHVQDPSSDPLGFRCCCQDLMKSRPLFQRPEQDAAPMTEKKNLMTVYHQTSPEICKLILDTNFKLGKGGWCGKAIYFATNPWATRTKAITAGSHGGCMIQAQVDLGNQKRFRSCGRYNSMNGAKLHQMGFDTIVFNPGDGDEIILFEPERVITKQIIPFNRRWWPYKHR